MFQTDAKVTNIATGATGTSATSDGQASTAHPQRLLGLSLAAGSDAATAIVYNANAASGTVVARLSALTGTSASFTAPHSGVKVDTNLFVAVTGTASNALVYWN
jgi:hypothetical protein|tara:strand:+ start:142 stop:453 length:312 start_codon:yes stop_codon:yes gene_type:complete